MKILKLKCPIPNGGGQNGKKPISPYDILPYLPDEECFFDSRHWVVGIDILPFAITTRIIANHQQFLLEVYEDNNGSNTEGQIVQENA